MTDLLHEERRLLAGIKPADAARLASLLRTLVQPFDA
jgi:hypothetical protein